ncbi:MAG: hypothetical protein PVI57_23480 [Gemmatimonadota bacterium]
MIRRTRSIAVLLVLLTAACASSSGGEGASSGEFEEQLGRVLYPPLQEAMDKILPKYRLALRRSEEQFASLYYETEWMTREVTAAEQAEGVTDARHRAIISGRRVGETIDRVGEFRVTFTAQNQVRSQAEPAWHPAPGPEAFFDFWEEVYNDLRLEVATGVRR